MNTRMKGRAGMLAAGSVVLAAVAPVALAAEPASDSVVVTGHKDWIALAYENTATGAYLDPDQSDVDGPQRAPFGTGSHKMTIGTSTVQTELYRTPKYDGTRLADLTRLEYSTFARRAGDTTGALRQPTYLRLTVDNDADGDVDESLFFYPADNAAQQPVANGVWQTWDVADGTMTASSTGLSTKLADYAVTHPLAELVNNDDPADGTKTTADGGALALINGGEGGGNADSQTKGEYFVDRVIVGAEGVETLFDLGDNVEESGGTTALTVDPDHMQNWYHQAYDNLEYLTSNQQFVDGPATPPVGGGSLLFPLNSGTNRDRVELFRTTQYDGTLLRDLRTLEFSTFQRANPGNTTVQQPVYLRLSVDNNADNLLDNTLFFFPGNNGTVKQSEWQGWNAGAGLWSVDTDQGPAAAVTLDDYLVAHPDAKVFKNADGNLPGGGVAFIAGGSGANQMNGEYYLDDVTIGKVDAATGHTASATAFDLETVSPAASIGNARVVEGNNGAWLSFPVKLDRTADRSVSVDYSTADGTATAGSDYVATSGTLTIPAGETTGVIAVKVLSNKVLEDNERMTVNLTSPGFGTLADASGRGTIVNDDTRVGLVLADAADHRVRVKVDTTPAAPGATVKVFRAVPGADTRLLKTELNSLGRISKVLAQRFKPGTTVTLYVTVRTENGVYTSKSVKRTVR